MDRDVVIVGAGVVGTAIARELTRFDLVAENPPGADLRPWIEAGATWCLTSFGRQPTRAEVEAAVQGGP